MKIPIYKLTGKALNWAILNDLCCPPEAIAKSLQDPTWEISKDWAVCGPLVPEYRINTRLLTLPHRTVWEAYDGHTMGVFINEDYLVAAMRCFIAQHNPGREDIEIPDNQV